MYVPVLSYLKTKDGDDMSNIGITVLRKPRLKVQKLVQISEQWRRLALSKPPYDAMGSNSSCRSPPGAPHQGQTRWFTSTMAAHPDIPSRGSGLGLSWSIIGEIWARQDSPLRPWMGIQSFLCAAPPTPFRSQFWDLGTAATPGFDDASAR